MGGDGNMPKHADWLLKTIVCACTVLDKKHVFEHNMFLSKTTPFNIQSGVRRPLNIPPRKYSFGQKHRPTTLEYTVLPKLFLLCIHGNMIITVYPHLLMLSILLEIVYNVLKKGREW